MVLAVEEGVHARAGDLHDLEVVGGEVDVGRDPGCDREECESGAVEGLVGGEALQQFGKAGGRCHWARCPSVEERMKLDGLMKL